MPALPANPDCPYGYYSSSTPTQDNGKDLPPMSDQPPQPDPRGLIEEALTEPTLGPASDRDAAQYWANLARKIAAALSAALDDNERVRGIVADDSEIVTICGSTKFKKEINLENSRLTQDGYVVISLGLFGHTDLPDYNWDTDATDLKTKLDRLHFQKIRMADRVHVVDPGGYVGESTRREIAYAESIGKPVTYYSKAGEL